MKPHTFADFFLHIQTHDPTWLALIDDKNGMSIKYGELIPLISSTAEYLTQHGVKPTDRVMLCGLQGLEWVIHFFALQLLQAIAVPIDTRIHPDSLHEFIALTQPKLIISNSSNFPSKTRSILPKPIIKSLQTTSNQFFTHQLKKFSNKKIISEIIFTSGTWSQPKGVTLSQQNLMANLAATAEAYPTFHNERLLSILPLSHIYEQMCGLYIPLLTGASIVYLDELTPSRLLSSLQKYQITYLVCVPRVLQLIQKSILKKIPVKLRFFFTKTVIKSRKLPISARRILWSSLHKTLSPSLQHFIVAGAPCHESLDHFFQGFGYQTILGYGLSETSPVVSFSNQSKSRVAGSVGYPLSNLDIKLNAQSEILIKGPSVFVGYWPNVRTEKWFNTQDIGYITADQQLVLTGRSKNLVIFPNGDKLFLEDIEFLVDSYPGIEESCVLYQPSNFNGILPIVISAQQKIDPADLKKYIQARLPMSVRIGEILNTTTTKLHRTHTLKLGRQKNWQEFSPLLDS